MRSPWGTMACTAPSTSHAQVALALTERQGFDFAYVLEPRAIQLYVRDPGYGFLAHISYVTGTDTTYAPVNPARLREPFQRRYAELCHAEFDAASSARRL